MPKRICAAEPATGSSAWAASFADSSGPEPPIAAAVAMMIAIEMMLANTAPVMVSIRTIRYSSGPLPLSATAAA